MRRNLLLGVPALLLAFGLGMVNGPSMAAELPGSPEVTVASIALEYLQEHPGGTLVADNEVVYPDGSGFIAVEVGTLSLSSCASGRFCMWSGTSYNGSLTYVTGSGVTHSLGTTVHSVWNNRTKAARLYNTSGTGSTCYAAGAKNSALTSGYQHPLKVYLSSGSSC